MKSKVLFSITALAMIISVMSFASAAYYTISAQDGSVDYIKSYTNFKSSFSTFYASNYDIAGLSTANLVLNAKAVVDSCNGADMNRDGKVDVSDLGIFAANYGRTDCSGANSWCTNADMNRDGKLDVSELGIFAANYGKSCTTVSETSAIVTLALNKVKSTETTSSITTEYSLMSGSFQEQGKLQRLSSEKVTTVFNKNTKKLDITGTGDARFSLTGMNAVKSP